MTAKSTRRSLGSVTVPTWLALVILVAASFLSVGIHASSHVGLSFLDEYVHIDYLDKVPTEVIVHHGEEVGDYARQQLGCRGLRVLAPSPDARCKASSLGNDALFPYDGRTAADIYTPIYFVTTWVLAQPIEWAGVHDITDAGRLVGGIWLAAALVFFFLALRRLGVRSLPSIGIGLLIAGSVPAYWANTYVSTDATGLLAGASALFFLARVEDLRRGYWWFLLLSPLLVLLKAQELAVVIAVALFLIFRAFADSWMASPVGISRWSGVLRDRRTIVAVIGAVIGVVSQFAWLAYRGATAVGVPAAPALSEKLSLTSISHDLFSVLMGVGAYGTNVTELGAPAFLVGNLTQLLIIGSLIGSLIALARRSIGFQLALAVVIATVVSGPGLSLINVVLSGYYFSLPPRYGISLIPLMLACGLLLLRRAPGRGVALGAIGAAGYVVSLFILH